jgi:hypothetical protein
MYNWRVHCIPPTVLPKSVAHRILIVSFQFYPLRKSLSGLELLLKAELDPHRTFLPPSNLKLHSSQPPWNLARSHVPLSLGGLKLGPQSSDISVV